MSYLEPSEFVTKMVDSGESKVYMSTKDTFIRAYMAGGCHSGVGGDFRDYRSGKNWFAINRCYFIPCRLYHAISNEV